MNSESTIGWSRDLKLDLVRGNTVEYLDDKVRGSLYRPFTKSNLFFDYWSNIAPLNQTDIAGKDFTENEHDS